jgi:phosphatidylglycerophosphatase C
VKDTGKRLALFDFDGTITRRDSMFDFLIYAVGYNKLLQGIIVRSPFLILYKLGLMSNHKAKETLMRYFFRNFEISRFKEIVARYSRERLQNIIKRSAVEIIEWHRSRGHRIVVVSASVDLWLTDWCELNCLELIATKLEEKDGRLTGNFLGRNCHGPEKVRRINERLELKDYDYIYAYGDSSGDLQMLELANEKYYRWNRIG